MTHRIDQYSKPCQSCRALATLPAGVTGSVFPEEKVTRLVTTLRRLPDLPDVAELATLASGT